MHAHAHMHTRTPYLLQAIVDHTHPAGTWGPLAAGDQYTPCRRLTRARVRGLGAHARAAAPRVGSR
jgi:hypothetical protein